MARLSDLDVINHVIRQTEEDAKFLGRSDPEYKAYQKGQRAGVSRAMAFLRMHDILKPVKIDGVIHYCF